MKYIAKIRYLKEKVVVLVSHLKTDYSFKSNTYRTAVKSPI